LRTAKNIDNNHLATAKRNRKTQILRQLELLIRMCMSPATSQYVCMIRNFTHLLFENAHREMFDIVDVGGLIGSDVGILIGRRHSTSI
jgi:hypothetical protein